MGLQNALVNALANPKRSIRIFIRTLILLLRAMCNLGNYNARHEILGIPQPRYYNTITEIDLTRSLLSILWVNDLSERLHEDERFVQKMTNFDYDAIVKAYFPTKNTALESVNINMCWKHSYFNPQNSLKPKQQRMKNLHINNDILFADMMTNTQGILKLKKVIPNTETAEKVKIFFEDLLKQNQDKILICDDDKLTLRFSDLPSINQSKQQPENLIDYLIDKQKLYYLDYPEMRENQSRKTNQNKYFNKITSTSDNSYDSYLEIPFAIFAPLKLDAHEEKIYCLGTVFNDTFYKTKKEDVLPAEIFHPFCTQQFQRDRFEMAKCHIASTDTNDFTIRVHLGILHYATSLYTTAFCNLAEEYPELSWMKTQFIDVFSDGLLQINFMANLTLVDDKEPLAEKIFYLSKNESLRIIKEQNGKFNILEQDAELMNEDVYESDAVKIARMYYEKLKKYVDFLFWKNHFTVDEKTKEYGKFIYEQMGTPQGDRFDGLPSSIVQDPTTESLKKIMINLAYLWVVKHGETFSLVSVSNNFYFVPPMMRKPLSELSSSHPLTEKDKQEWLPPSDIIKDSMTLHKVVTYRDDKDSLISAWQEIKIGNDQWKLYYLQPLSNYTTQKFNLDNSEQRILVRQKKSIENFTGTKQEETSKEFQKFQDFWNDQTMSVYELNFARTKKGLFNLHWLLPHELSIALNI